MQPQLKLICRTTLALSFSLCALLCTCASSSTSLAALSPYSQEQADQDKLQRLREARRSNDFSPRSPTSNKRNQEAQSERPRSGLQPALPGSRGEIQGTLPKTYRASAFDPENSISAFDYFTRPQNLNDYCALLAKQPAGNKGRPVAVKILGRHQATVAVLIGGTPLTVSINLNDIDLKDRLSGTTELNCASSRAGEIRFYNLKGLNYQGAVLEVKADGQRATSTLRSE